jgi:hypothetical protein
MTGWEGDEHRAEETVQEEVILGMEEEEEAEEQEDKEAAEAQEAQEAQEEQEEQEEQDQEDDAMADDKVPTDAAKATKKQKKDPNAPKKASCARKCVVMPSSEQHTLRRQSHALTCACLRARTASL